MHNHRPPTTKRELWIVVRFLLLIAAVLLAIYWLSADSGAARGAGFRTDNFVVSAPTDNLARAIASQAERCRKELAVLWLGKELDGNWRRPCPIHAVVSPGVGATGKTKFVYSDGEVFGWTMRVQGTARQVLYSVIPHEVTHTIFASHFRQPIPRWADEGACTLVESRLERSKSRDMLLEFLRNRRGIPFSNMFAMTEYPDDLLPLYAQGHSLASFLIDGSGHREFVRFLESGLLHKDWARAMHEAYGYESIGALQKNWLAWVRDGRPSNMIAATVVSR